MCCARSCSIANLRQHASQIFILLADIAGIAIKKCSLAAELNDTLADVSRNLFLIQ